MTVEIVLAILAAHWVADFVCQSDQMAVNKSRSNGWLTAHVMTYTVVMFPVAYYLFHEYKFDLVMAWLILNGALHWITDYTTSRISSWFWQRERRHDFFVTIGFDQLIHYSCLFWSYAQMVEVNVK